MKKMNKKEGCILYEEPSEEQQKKDKVLINKLPENFNTEKLIKLWKDQK